MAALYNFGTVAAGAAKEVQFRARNTGASAVVITTLAVIGDGFTIVNSPSVPYSVAPGNVLPFNFAVQFAGGPPATYSANLELNNISVLLVSLRCPPQPSPCPRRVPDRIRPVWLTSLRALWPRDGRSPEQPAERCIRLETE